MITNELVRAYGNGVNGLSSQSIVMSGQTISSKYLSNKLIRAQQALRHWVW